MRPAAPIPATTVEAAIRRLALSARGYDRGLNVARTIADLAGADNLEVDHLAQALQYRDQKEA